MGKGFRRKGYNKTVNGKLKAKTSGTKENPNPITGKMKIQTENEKGKSIKIIKSRGMMVQWSAVRRTVGVCVGGAGCPQGVKNVPPREHHNTHKSNLPLLFKTGRNIQI